MDTWTCGGVSTVMSRIVDAVNVSCRFMVTVGDSVVMVVLLFVVCCGSLGLRFWWIVGGEWWPVTLPIL